jgi:hypothetical protein
MYLTGQRRNCAGVLTQQRRTPSRVGSNVSRTQRGRLQPTHPIKGDGSNADVIGSIVHAPISNLIALKRDCGVTQPPTRVTAPPSACNGDMGVRVRVRCGCARVRARVFAAAAVCASVRAPCLQLLQDVQQRERVLSAGHAEQHLR